MRFPVLVNWHCALSHANQPKIQNLEETWCVKITSNRTFLDIAGLSFPQSNFYIHCHLRILGLTKTAILIVKLSGCPYLFGHKSLVKSVAGQYSQASQSNQLSDAFLPEVAYYATNNPNHVFFFFS